MSTERNEYIFKWFIENFSYCWHKNGETLESPKFMVDGLEGPVWNLSLSPRGENDDNIGYISLYLTRNDVEGGPEELPLKFAISVLEADGTTYQRDEIEYTFKKGMEYGIGKFINMHELILDKDLILTQDIFTVCCEIQSNGPIAQIPSDEVSYCDFSFATTVCARTRIGKREISFLHETENFSTLKPYQNKTVDVGFSSIEGLALKCSLYFRDCECCDKNLMVKITPSGTNNILSKCKIYLLGSSGTNIDCGEVNNQLQALWKDIRIVPLSLSMQDILSRPVELLPNDKLTFYCECSFSTEVEFNKIEKIEFQKSFLAVNENKYSYDATEFLSKTSSGLSDLKEIYRNGLLTDLEVKTDTKSFPAHKMVLCARSSVFKAMLTNNMKEMNANCIQIDDLEDDIIHQFLEFLYSDKLENIHWQSAIKLYYAADKYEVEKLKVICTSFLIENLTIHTVSELLLLADTHYDTHLENAVGNFILENEEEVWSSEEFEKLKKTHPQLVLKAIGRKYTRKA